MRLDWMMLANNAEDHGGLVTLMGGGWDTINVEVQDEPPPDVPLARIQGVLVIRLLFGLGETNREYPVEIRIVDQDGQQVARADGSLTVERAEGVPVGWDQAALMLVPLTGIALPRFEHYSISLFVAGQHLGERPFRVVRVN